MIRSRSSDAKPRTLQLLLTCEHATNRVPLRFASLFRPHQALLDSHRGYDPGALALARHMHKHLDAPLLSTNVSRLLVENNRSLHHNDLFSLVSRLLDEHTRQSIIAQYYMPHRLETISKAII